MFYGQHALTICAYRYCIISGASWGVGCVIIICLAADHSCVEWRAQAVGFVIAVMSFGFLQGYETIIGDVLHIVLLAVVCVPIVFCAIIFVPDDLYVSTYHKSISSRNKWLVTTARSKYADLFYFCVLFCK